MATETEQKPAHYYIVFLKQDYLDNRPDAIYEERAIIRTLDYKEARGVYNDLAKQSKGVKLCLYSSDVKTGIALRKQDAPKNKKDE